MPREHTFWTLGSAVVFGRGRATQGLDTFIRYFDNSSPSRPSLEDVWAVFSKVLSTYITRMDDVRRILLQLERAY
ncbi:MAG: hypothetical protein KAR39_05300 [Thermoplasmata archaeon]|nr:hypothetical protein [Thermoplasmata archaeon]